MKLPTTFNNMNLYHLKVKTVPFDACWFHKIGNVLKCLFPGALCNVLR